VTISAMRPRPRLAPIAVFLNLLALAVLTALTAAGVERTLATRQLRLQTSDLANNLTKLAEAQQVNLDRLQAEAALAASDLAEAQSASPDLSAPYAVYGRGFALGPEYQVQVTSIERQAEVVENTALGPVSVLTYSVDLSGRIPDCLSYISAIEREGQPFLATDNLSLSAASGDCRFQVFVLGTDSTGQPVSP
jgi:hypothetical protein